MTRAHDRGPSGGALSSGTSLHDSMADVANASRCQREFSASLVNATGKVDIDGYFSDDPASAEGNVRWQSIHT